MRFQSISQESFQSCFYGRTPFVRLFSTELEWFVFEHSDTTLLAVMLQCEIDKDLNAIVLGRDRRKKFRAINVIVSKNSRDELFAELDACIDKLLESHVEGLFPQGDEATAAFELFASQVPEEKRNHYFKLLTEDPAYYPGRVILEELAYWFNDPDGKFIRALQGNEFNSRLFEIYLHAAFYEWEFDIDRSHKQPDFLLVKNGQTVSVEAATVSEEAVDISPVKLGKNFLDELDEYVRVEMPFRFSRTLRNKVRHTPEPAKLHYWELPHTVGHPFVLAVHDYSRRLSMSFSSIAMQSYLYGLGEHEGKVFPIERHEMGSRTIPSNFFASERHRHISAVMLPTGATLPKFNRMGRVAGLRSPTSFAIIKGARTDSQGEVKAFEALVDHPSYHEYWRDGIYIYHNPNALYPLNPELFPGVVHVFQEKDGLMQIIPPDFILSSMTEMLNVPEDQVDAFWRKFEVKNAPADAADDGRGG